MENNANESSWIQLNLAYFIIFMKQLIMQQHMSVKITGRIAVATVSDEKIC